MRPLSAHKQTVRVQFTLPKWTVWPGSQRLELSFSSLFAASPWQRIQKSHCVLGEEGRGRKKGPVDTTQWHFCGTWGEPGSFRWAGQGWVFTLLKREDLARLKRRRLGQRCDVDQTHKLTSWIEVGDLVICSWNTHLAYEKWKILRYLFKCFKSFLNFCQVLRDTSVLYWMMTQWLSQSGNKLGPTCGTTVRGVTAPHRSAAVAYSWEAY